MLRRFNDTSDATGVKEWITKHDFNSDSKVTYDEMMKEVTLE
jgi:hypothetical protein